MRYPESNGSHRLDQSGVPHTPDPDQGNLFDQADAADELTDAFLAFHAANPQVWNTLGKLAKEWKDAGKLRCGIALLYNTVRWKLSMEIEGDGAFELNDHYQAYYARALMQFVPELAGMFEIRRAPQADRWIATYQDQAAA
jgi:hypothetical protein